MLDVQIIGAEQAVARFQNLRQQINSLQPAFEDMAPDIIQELKANWPAKGALFGEEWAPRKRDYSWPILNKTGKMRESWVPTPSAQQLEIKNITEYATYHNFGTVYLPVRKLVGHSTSMLQIVQQKIQLFLKNFL